MTGRKIDNPFRGQEKCQKQRAPYLGILLEFPGNFERFGFKARAAHGPKYGVNRVNCCKLWVSLGFATFSYTMQRSLSEWGGGWWWALLKSILPICGSQSNAQMLKSYLGKALRIPLQCPTEVPNRRDVFQLLV